MLIDRYTLATLSFQAPQHHLAIILLNAKWCLFKDAPRVLAEDKNTMVYSLTLSPFSECFRAMP